MFIFLVVLLLSMITFTINFQAECRNLNLKLFIEVISCLPIRDEILTRPVKIGKNALDSMAMSPDRENVSIFENYPQLINRYANLNSVIREIRKKFDT